MTLTLTLLRFIDYLYIHRYIHTLIHTYPEIISSLNLGCVSLLIPEEDLDLELRLLRDDDDRDRPMELLSREWGAMMMFEVRVSEIIFFTGEGSVVSDVFEAGFVGDTEDDDWLFLRRLRILYPLEVESGRSVVFDLRSSSALAFAGLAPLLSLPC